MAENNTKNDEQIFNEDELQDIMNEFETLEREFHEGSEDDVQEEVQASADDETEEVVAEGELHVSEELEPEVSEVEDHSEAEHDNVVAMATAKPKASTPTPATAPSSSQAVSMSLEFPIGDQVAQIGISPEYGFSFNMDGVELTIDEENGCVMTLPGGMTFSIPVTKSAKHKKSA